MKPLIENLKSDPSVEELAIESFIKKYKFPIELLTDEELRLAKRNGYKLMDAMNSEIISEYQLREIFGSKSKTENLSEVKNRAFELRMILISRDLPIPLNRLDPIDYFRLALKLRSEMDEDDRNRYTVFEIYKAAETLINEATVDTAA
ncbi:MAG: hypothetical protein ACMG57_00980 [Candidatus Dojkabacteria bacterium]